MELTDSQNLVIKWWHTNRDYRSGIMLLAQFCKNKTLVRTLSRKTEQFGRKKLEYELTKSVRLKHLEMPELFTETDENINTSNETVLSSIHPSFSLMSPLGTSEAEGCPTPTPPSENSDEENNPLSDTEIHVFEKSIPIISDKPTGQYPKIIRRLKHEYSELYKKRGICHKKMAEVPELNNPENNKLRSVYLQQVKDAAIRMEFLYGHINQYETKNIIPAEDIIWPKPKPDDLLTATAPNLSKRRQLLLNANYKDKNLLRFQQIKKADKENPIPEGPKREKIKLRMQKRLKEINRIEIQLVEIEKNAD